MSPTPAESTTIHAHAITSGWSAGSTGLSTTALMKSATSPVMSARVAMLSPRCESAASVPFLRSSRLTAFARYLGGKRGATGGRGREGDGSGRVSLRGEQEPRGCVHCVGSAPVYKHRVGDDTGS